MTVDYAMSHEDAVELAALFVLGQLEPEEARAVRQHLATCSRPHPELGELHAALAELPRSLEPVDAPPQLRARVIGAVRADAYGRAAATPELRQGPPPVRIEQLAQRRQPSFLLAAAFGLAVLTAATAILGLQLRDVNARATTLRAALTALTDPQSRVADVEGHGVAVSGFVALPPDDSGYLVIRGLPAAPPGKAYQAWYMTDSGPRSAGLLGPIDERFLVLSDLRAPPKTSAMAVTLETAPGANAPTTAPIADAPLPP